MLEIDFLPVEAVDGPGSKSGDAIAMRFSVPSLGRAAVVVIDGGYTAIGDSLVRHIRNYYKTDEVDLVVCTHPDADHLNGLIRVVDELTVSELMLHLPWEHRDDVSEYSNIEKIEELFTLAQSKGVIVTEPFAGEVRFDGAFTILGPSVEYYTELLSKDLGEEQARALEKSTFSVTESLIALSAAKSHEPLDDSDTTSARNNSSVIAMLDAADELHLFTGDAGITALEGAADEFERAGSSFSSRQIEFFHVPHHGSRRNLGPAILDRIFPNGATNTTAFISSGALDEKHPGAAVIDALKERSFATYATEGQLLLHGHDAVSRPNYFEATERG